MSEKRAVSMESGQLTKIQPGDTLYTSPLGDSEDLPAVAGTQATNSTSVVSVGSLVFNPANFVTTQGNTTRSIKFAVLGFATPGMTAEFTLYNVTDGAVVSAATLTTSANSVVSLESAALVIPTDLPNSSKLYDVRLRISSGTPGPTDAAVIRWAGLKVYYT